MTIWQADFYKPPQPQAQPTWRLLICHPDGQLIYEATCPQAEAGVAWLVEQLQAVGEQPDVIQVFRPETLNLMKLAAEKFGWSVAATRRVPALKQLCRSRGLTADLIQLPPQSLPDRLWGEKWRFATILAGDIRDVFCDRPIPILSVPGDLDAIALGLASTAPIPGVIIYGGRQSMQLARWLQSAQPAAIHYIPTEAGKSGGLVLETGLIDRWILATFEDTEVAQAALNYNQRLANSQGLHFLLIQPDDSGVTDTGFWLLQSC
jgi:hypothetical protein